MINNNIWVVVCDFMQILPFHMVKWVYKTPTKNNFTFKIGRFRVFFFLSRVIVLIEQKQEIDAKKMKRFVMLILNKILSTNEYRERMKWYRE